MMAVHFANLKELYMKGVGFYLALGVFACVASVAAEIGQTGMQPRIDAQVKIAQRWASNPVVVAAVKAQNAAAPAGFASMTQDTWAAAAAGDAFVQGFATNKVAALLKGQKSDVMSEVFVNAADGRKVAFLAKTSSWSHKGSPKHDVPMTGKTWQGEPMMDESSKIESIQIAVPVMDGGKAIGSIVVGLDVAKLK
jgi:hypothetical protein